MNPDEAKDRSRGYDTSMTPEAVEKRLRIVSQLRELTRVLGQAQVVGRIDADGNIIPIENSPAADDAPTNTADADLS